MISEEKRVASVASTEDDRYSRPDAKNLPRKLDPGDGRHGLIRDDKIEAGRVLFREIQGLPAACSACHLIAKLCKKRFAHHHLGRRTPIFSLSRTCVPCSLAHVTTKRPCL